MNTLHFPWLEMAILLPLAGAFWVARQRSAEAAQRATAIVTVLTLGLTIGAWVEFGSLHTFEAHDGFDVVSRFLGSDAVVIDELSAPLLPLAALLYLATTLATLRTKVKRFSFAGSLVSESILLGTLSCRDPWGITILLILGVLPPLFELRDRGKPMRVFALHMGLFAALLVAGRVLIDQASPAQPWMLGMGLLTAAVLLRSGIAPVHVWMSDLFENASFGTALLFVTPMVGAYAALRLVLPIAPDWALRSIALLSLFTAVYAAGMALIQKEARRFFCYIFLSHSSLVLVGLEIATPIGLTGALSLMLSIGLALAGFGLTLRSIESRTGRLSLAGFKGLYEHTPTLAVFFLLTGLASVGFPGTFGFVGTELLVESAVDAYPLVGAIVVLAAALNGIAVLQAYFRIFTGARHTASISLRSRFSERMAVLTLTVLILGGGILPQPGISSRYHAALELLDRSGKLPAEEAHVATGQWPWLFGPVVDHPARESQKRVTLRTGPATTSPANHQPSTIKE